MDDACKSSGGDQCAWRERQHRIALRLRAAARLLDDDRDAAALLLDGVIAEIADLWRSARGMPVPRLALVPAAVERRDQRFGVWLRLALRAPQVEARLVHCEELLRLLDEGERKA
ncbi:MAG: hypothetical protein ACHQ4H_11010 [Ktedonobacterales bacterium]